MRELLALVPPEGDPWPRESRERWVRAIGAVADLVYEDAPTAAPSPAAHRTLDLRDDAPVAAGRHSRHPRPVPTPAADAASGHAPPAQTELFGSERRTAYP